MNKRIPSLLAVLLVGVIYLEGGVDFVEHRLMDLRFRLLGQEPTGKVVVVAADARSLESLKVWPWPRGYHATVLNHLLEAGAREVAFDLDDNGVSWLAVSCPGGGSGTSKPPR